MSVMVNTEVHQSQKKCLLLLVSLENPNLCRATSSSSCMITTSTTLSVSVGHAGISNTTTLDELPTVYFSISQCHPERVSHRRRNSITLTWDVCQSTSRSTYAIFLFDHQWSEFWLSCPRADRSSEVRLIALVIDRNLQNSRGDETKRRIKSKALLSFIMME